MYIHATLTFRSSDCLFGLPRGSGKVARASSKVIVSWIVKVSSLLYTVGGIVLLEVTARPPGQLPVETQ